MKVVVVLPMGYRFCSAYPNSIETVVRNQNQKPVKGQEVVVLCERGARQRCGIRVIELVTDGLRNVYMSEVEAALWNLQPDIIEFHQDAKNCAVLARQFQSCGTILYRHNYVKPGRFPWDTIRRRNRLASFDAIVFVSESTRDDFNLRYPGFERNSFVLSNPIDTREWTGNPKQREKTILFVGRAAPEKGLGPYCKAMASILKSKPDWRASFILGESQKHRRWLSACLGKLNSHVAQIDIALDQPTEQVKAAMAKAAIVVVPSLWKEPFGLVAAEAMASGCALITSGHGGLAEVCGPHALYVNPRSIDSLVEAIQWLIEQSDERESLAQAGQDFARATHDLSCRQAQLSAFRHQILVQKA